MRKHISWDCSFKDSTHLVMGLQVAWSRREIVEETHTYQCSFKDSTHLVMGLQVARSRREQSVMQCTSTSLRLPDIARDTKTEEYFFILLIF